MEYLMRPIGIIHSPFQDKGITPIQPSRSQSLGRVEVYPEFSAGLKDLDGFSYIILLYVFHCSEGYALEVQPFLDNQLRGLFATRYPCRPNPIGLSVVKLVSIQNNIIEIDGVDVLDGTPLLDIKPYVAEFDRKDGGRAGWFEKRESQE